MRKINDKVIEAFIIDCLFEFSQEISEEILIDNISCVYECSRSQVENCLKKLEKQEKIVKNYNGNIILIKK